MSSLTIPRRFTVRRKVLKLFGGGFYILDHSQRLLGYSAQAAFRLKEDIKVFADLDRSRPILHITTRQVLDFGASYDVVDLESGELVGSARRKGLSSLVRDAWELFDAGGAPLGKLEEDSMAMALLRRFLANLIPQRFHLDIGRHRIELDQRFNPFVYRLDVTIPPDADVDHRLVLGLAILITAIEGRQD